MYYLIYAAQSYYIGLPASSIMGIAPMLKAVKYSKNVLAMKRSLDLEYME